MKKAKFFGVTALLVFLGALVVSCGMSIEEVTAAVKEDVGKYLTDNSDSDFAPPVITALSLVKDEKDKTKYTGEIEFDFADSARKEKRIRHYLRNLVININDDDTVAWEFEGRMSEEELADMVREDVVENFTNKAHKDFKDKTQVGEFSLVRDREDSDNYTGIVEFDFADPERPAKRIRHYKRDITVTYDGGSGFTWDLGRMPVEELTDVVSESILENLRRRTSHPQTRKDVAVTKLTLIHKGGNEYTGSVSYKYSPPATSLSDYYGMRGIIRSFTSSIVVIYDGNGFSWEIK
jgi:hypothetical protein